MTFHDFLIYLPFLSILVFFILIIPFLDERSQNTRIILSIIMGIIFIRYIEWRFFQTVLPVDYRSAEGKWVWFCFILEFIGWVENMIFHFMMLKQRDNTRHAGFLEKAMVKLQKQELPHVDVFIPTYNEEWDILEKTILGCKNMIWSKEKLHIYVLDDGKRDWLKMRCQELDVHYISREGNKDAKAGNINNAFSKTYSSYIAFFDADFIPQQNFLTRTMGFFQDPKVAIVQTPQVFYNFDFMQTNLGVFHDILDDQRLFFDVIMPARDGWDSAFFCGSCAVIKRAPVLEVGGLSSESVTEDILLSVKLLSKGYVTRYLNEPLSHGLAAQTIEAFTIQRKRWCQGGIQLLFAKKGIFSRHLPFIHRVFFFPLSWIIHPLLRLLTLIIPIVYLFTGTLPLHIGYPSDIMHYQIPVFVGSYLLMLWHAPWRWIPVLTTAFENITAINLIPTIFKSFFDPKSKVFKVTPKGNNFQGLRFHALSFGVSCLLFLLLLSGLLMNFIPKYQVVSSSSLMPVAAAWAFFCLLITVFMMTMSLERPRYRQEERFSVHLKATLKSPDHTFEMHASDLSIFGSQLHCDIAQESLQMYKGELLELTLFGLNTPLNARIIEASPLKVRVALEHQTDQQRQDLIVFLYTTPLIIKKETLMSAKRLLKKVFHRLFGNHKELQRLSKMSKK